MMTPERRGYVRPGAFFAVYVCSKCGYRERPAVVNEQLFKRRRPCPECNKAARPESEANQ